MKRVGTWWVVGSAVGGLLVALPDDDDRVVSISATHGPSAVDLVGTLVLLAAWAPVPVTLWRCRAAVGRRVWRLALPLAALGLVALAVTIRFDIGWWWVVPVAGLVLVQLWLLHAVARGRAA